MMASQLEFGRRRWRAGNRRGFTLIEILVVVGIILLIIGIALPALWLAQRGAAKTAGASDLQAISTALEAYKLDHGDYPRVSFTEDANRDGVLDVAEDTNQNSPGPNTPPDAERGSEVLCRALLGPQPATTPPWSSAGVSYKVNDFVIHPNASGPIQYVCVADHVSTAGNPPDGGGSGLWVIYYCAPGGAGGVHGDLQDGYGFRSRVGGKVHGPYLQPDQFKVVGGEIVDRDGMPILYFPARSKKPDISAVPNFISAVASPVPAAISVPPAVPTDVQLSLYDMSDNWQAFVHPEDDDASAPANWTILAPQYRIHAMLGDADCDGRILFETPTNDLDADGVQDVEKAPDDRPYLLWTAGPDRVFGPLDIKAGNPANTVPNTGTPALREDQYNQKIVRECDDVTNFR